MRKRSISFSSTKLPHGIASNPTVVRQHTRSNNASQKASFRMKNLVVYADAFGLEVVGMLIARTGFPKTPTVVSASAAL